MKFETIFLKIWGAITNTTASILGLFVFILMHFSCWILLWQWKFEFWKFLKMLENCGLSSAHDSCVERVKALRKEAIYHICSNQCSFVVCFFWTISFECCSRMLNFCEAITVQDVESIKVNCEITTKFNIKISIYAHRAVLIFHRHYEL